MPKISDVLIVDVSGKIPLRDTKHCVCISVSKDKYLLINTDHREMYDDFQIKSSDYAFLKDTDRFVCCSKMYRFSPDRIIKKTGNLNRSDMIKIIDKIQNSKILDKMEKNSVIPELDKWLSDNPQVAR
jgi:hypothetical protein